MLGYGVMASNRIKSGLQVTESDGSSASDHTTVLYLDPVHAAPGDPPYGPRIINYVRECAPVGAENTLYD